LIILITFLKYFNIQEYTHFLIDLMSILFMLLLQYDHLFHTMIHLMFLPCWKNDLDLMNLNGLLYPLIDNLLSYGCCMLLTRTNFHIKQQSWSFQSTALFFWICLNEGWSILVPYKHVFPFWSLCSFYISNIIILLYFSNQIIFRLALLMLLSIAMNL